MTQLYQAMKLAQV